MQLQESPHEFTNNWITRGQRHFRRFCSRSSPATNQTCPSDNRNAPRSDVGKHLGVYHFRRTQYLDVATLVTPRDLTTFVIRHFSNSAETSTYDRSSWVTDEQPSSF